jgi:hypothetical protein
MAREVTTGIKRVWMLIDRNYGTEVENVSGVVDMLNRKPMWIRPKVDVCHPQPLTSIISQFIICCHVPSRWCVTGLLTVSLSIP